MTASDSLVVDTNVLAVAEGMHDGASDHCKLNCVSLLRRIEGGVILAVDAGDEVLSEYLGALRGSGTSGPGKKLATALWRRRHDPAVCRKVHINSIDRPPGSYAEVPESLRDFDTDDQKFLAVAVAEGSQPPLFQALDTEWWLRRQDISREGIDVQFLCASDLM